MKQQRHGYRTALATGLLLSVTMAPLAAAELDPAAEALDDQTLDSLRGGFILDGFEISIGIEQIVAVNGDIQVDNQLFISDLNEASVAHSQAVDQVVNQTINHQIGADLLVATNPIQGSGILTQIQNSLDHSLIQNIRSLNIELSNMGHINAITPLLGSHFLLSPGR